MESRRLGSGSPMALLVSLAVIASLLLVGVPNAAGQEEPQEPVEVAAVEEGPDAVEEAPEEASPAPEEQADLGPATISEPKATTPPSSVPGWNYVLTFTSGGWQVKPGSAYVVTNTQSATFDIYEMASGDTSLEPPAGATPVARCTMSNNRCSGGVSLNQTSEGTSNLVGVGVKAGTRYLVVQVQSQSGWFMNPSLDLGPMDAPVRTPYRYNFLTGPAQPTTAPEYAATMLPVQLTLSADGVTNGRPVGVAGQTESRWANSLLNPAYDKCGMSVGLLLDMSGAVDGGAAAGVKSRANDLLDALAGTPASVALHSFDATGAQVSAPTSVLDGVASLKSQVSGLSPSNTPSNLMAGLTAMINTPTSGAGDNPPKIYDVIVVISPGNPTTFTGMPTGTSWSQSSTYDFDVEKAIFAANSAKRAGTAVFAVGVPGDGGKVSLNNLRAISGPTLGTDYFNNETAALASQIKTKMYQACQGSVSVSKKFARSWDQVGSVPLEPNWAFDSSGYGVSPSSASTGTGASPSAAVFKVDFEPFVTSRDVTVTEPVAGDLLQNPDPSRFVQCTLADGSAVPPSRVVPVSGGITVLDVGFQEKVSCLMVNEAKPSFTYEVTANRPSVEKTAPQVPQPVVYTYTVKNTGNRALSNVAIAGGLGTRSCTVDGGPASSSLAVGKSMVCTSTYAVPQSDLDSALQVVNNSTLTASWLSEALPAAQQSVSVPVARLTLEKTADVKDVDAAGQAIGYTFTVKNTGGAPVEQVRVDDPLPGLSQVRCSQLSPAGYLPVGGAMSCSASYVVTQQDLEDGRLISNTATVSGVAPSDGEVSAVSTVDVQAVARVAVELEKTANPIAVTKAGETVKYTFVARNSGNVALADVRISDEMKGLKWEVCSVGASLAPGDELTCTASYTVTQADVDAGGVHNDATASGVSGKGVPAESAVASQTVVIGSVPGLALTTTADRGSVSAAGEPVEFKVVARNTGNVTLSGVEIADGLAGMSQLRCLEPGMGGSLAPGEELSCTGTYAVTQQDLDAAAPIVNEATARAQAPAPVIEGSAERAASARAGDPVVVTASARVRVEVRSLPGVELSKSASTALVSEAGQVVRFTMTAKNTGNVTLDSVAVSDAMPGLSGLSCSAEVPGTLAPGQSLVCTGDYTATAADLATGAVSNTAVVDAVSRSGQRVSDTASVNVPAQAPAGNGNGNGNGAGGGSLADTGAAGWLRTGAMLALLAIAAGVLLHSRARRSNG